MWRSLSILGIEDRSNAGTLISGIVLDYLAIQHRSIVDSSLRLQG